MKKKDKIGKEELKLYSDKIKSRDRKIKSVRLSLLIMTLFLVCLYCVLRIVYEMGGFTVSLDPAFAKKSGLIMYENFAEKEDKRILKAEKVDFMDNISVKWLPENLNNAGDGSHNGDNYLAYTFYLENKGVEAINYWYEIMIDDVIRNVDKAIRVMLYINDERAIYAKQNEKTGEAEEGTEKFYSSDEVVIKPRRDFKPGNIDKLTIVVFIEGDDPDCIDELIGGEMKMHMDITEEHIAQNDNNEEK